MISYLSGVIVFKSDKSVTVDVRGVGYEVYLPLPWLEQLRLGEPVSVYAYLHVREELMDLYGFASPEDRSFFKLLLGVRGVGPRSALMILSLTTQEELTRAIAKDDPSLLTKVSGIGTKTAERLIVELKGKVKISAGREQAAEGEDGDVIDALVHLGYTVHEARATVRRIDPSLESTSQRVRAALKLLGKKK